MKLPKLGKRGEVEEMLEHIPYLILTVVVLGGIYLILSYATHPQIDTAAVQAETFSLRILHAPGSISYTDPLTGSPRPGIIAEEKFNSETLDNSTIYDYERQVSARLDLYLADQSYSSEPIKTIYYNKIWYERLEPLRNIKGNGGSRVFEKIVPVIYTQGENDINAVLKMRIVIPN